MIYEIKMIETFYVARMYLFSTSKQYRYKKTNRSRHVFHFYVNESNLLYAFTKKNEGLKKKNNKHKTRSEILASVAR